MLSFGRFFASWLVTSQQASSTPAPNHVDNANHIFNAIHSSGRQWGSSLNHNGMSLFIATVPAGIELYHGTSKSTPPTGLEWLAFEPEHALGFARPRRNPMKPPPPTTTNNKIRRADDEHQVASMRSKEQLPLVDAPDEHGFLHTYQPKRNLRLLYIDGQSAAKSDKGTLDLQDVVLLHDYPPPLHETEPRRHRGPLNEGWRAETLCKLAQKDWRGQIDGFVRMELGFEIIVCSFEASLEVKRITQTQSSSPGMHRGSAMGFATYKAVASRFDGMQDHRLALKYDDFVTLFAEQNATFFDEYNLPRARNDSAIIRGVQKKVKNMIRQESSSRPVDWQAVTDMVVSRYSDFIEYLASGDVEDLKELQAHIERLFRPYVDYGERDKVKEIDRCATQYLPQTASWTGLAPRSILNVTTTICAAFSNATSYATTGQAIEAIRQMKEWLAWTPWKRCRGCAYNEVCLLPIWPVGGKRDHEQPRCTSSVSDGPNDYWGSGGGPHGHPPPVNSKYGEDENLNHAAFD